jgi:hypothetical protein
MPNILNKPKEPAAPETPVPAPDIQAIERAARAEGMAQQLANENQRLQNFMARGQQAPPPPAGPDPFAKFGGEHLTATPEEIQKNLDMGTRQRIRQEMGPALADMDRRNNARVIEAENRGALNSLLSNNPDIAQDAEGFAASVAKAGFRAQQQGLNMDGPAMANLALSIYRKDHGQPENLPFVEGAGRPGRMTAPPEKPKGPSLYEEFYGKGSDDELHEEKADMSAVTDGYMDGRMGILDHVGGGFAVETSGVRQVAGQNVERASRRKAAGE